MDDKYLLATVCVICLTCIGVTALLRGINSTLLGGIIAAITGVFGACIGVKIHTYLSKEN